MLKSTKILYTAIILLFVLHGFAQPVSLKIILKDTLTNYYNHPHFYNNYTEIRKQLQKELLFWQKQNYLEVSFDSIIPDSNSLTAFMHLGKPYDVNHIGFQKRGTNKNKAEYTSASFAEVETQIEKRIHELEQNGFPFAQINMHPIQLEGGHLFIQLKTDSGLFVTYDSVLITGNSSQDKLFLMRYLNIRPNTPYNEQTVRQLDRHLEQLPFIKVVRPSSVYFYQDKAQIIINIDDKPSNSFEGIVGVRSDENNAHRYKVSGDVNLSLNNVLATATSIKLQWRRFGVQNTDLEVRGFYPYLLGAPLALSDVFSLFRQDSSFQRLKNNFGFSYLFNGLNAVQFYYTAEKSVASLNAAQKFEALETNTLPPVNDYLNKNYGVKISFMNLDNIFNPSHGMNSVTDVSTGTHKIVENAFLKGARRSNGTNYSVYDSLPKQNSTWQLFNLTDLFYSISKRNVMNVFVQGATMYHPNIFYNEQFQLGGLRTFRGVNELAIKATSYALLRLEYRYILPQTGYFNLFCNGIWFESNIVNSYQKKTLLGFGGGLGIQTKGGMLTVVYALANENNFILKLGKVHIGFTAVF